MQLTIQWNESLATIGRRLLGHNAVWSRGGLGLWDEQARAVRPDVEALVAALQPGMLRWPGGTRAMRYHFDETIGPVADRKPQCDTFTGELDATTWGMDEALQFAERIGADVAMVTPWGDGTPERAAAMVAYANATIDSAVAIGVDANGRDWGTAAEWAARRAANGHPAPYRVAMVEIGNEPYLDLRPGKPVCGTDRPFTQAERLENGVYIPSTARDAAQQIVKTARLVKQVDPHILVGAPALTDVVGVKQDPTTAISEVDRRLGTGDAWNPTLAQLAGADFDFWALHIYSFARTPDRVQLSDELRHTIAQLRSIGGPPRFAVTELGTLFHAETQLNALLSADFVRVAAEEGVLACLRHILIEDRPSGLFASSAAILGDAHTPMPGYHAMALLAAALQPIAVRWQSPEPHVVVLASRDDATTKLGIAVIDRRIAASATEITLTLPPVGSDTWRGELAIESAPALTSPAVAVTRSALSVTDTITFTLPAHGLAVIRLER